MENYLNRQLKFNNIVEKLIANNKSVNAYILVADDLDLLKQASIILAKVLVCPKKYKLNCNECNICKRIDNNEFSELEIINPINRIIKKSSIIDVRERFKTKSIEAKNQVYIINQAEYLGSSAANSILKFLEEPDSNSVAIFTTINLSLVLETIKSRCQVIKLNNIDDTQGIDYVKKYAKCDEKLIDITLDFIYEIENNYSNSITIVNEVVEKITEKETLQSMFNIMFLIYMDKLNLLLFDKEKYFNNSNKFNEIVLKDKENIMQKIVFILDNIPKINYNINNLLFLSNFVIEMGEINGKSNRSKI